MIKFLSLTITAAFLIGCANKEQIDNEPLSLAEDKTRIVGIWAMVPLRNGIANVAEYKSDGQVLLHAYNCAKPGKQEIETSNYVVADDGRSVHIKSPMDEFDLKVIKFTRQTMRLEMPVADSALTFGYLKVDKVAPLCNLYEALNIVESKGTPYKASDFAPAPTIPAHANISRYVGSWANDKGEVQVSIAQDANANAYLYLPTTENWHYLYNDVRWVGDELHFQSYAYSEKERLFRHPYHKSKTASILQPMADGKMLHSFFIGDKRFDYVLTRASH